MPNDAQDRSAESQFDQIWRRKSVESHIYPGLCLSDNRQSGSITVGCTRLPVWSIIGEVIRDGWDSAEHSYSIEEYGWTAEKMAEFIYYLMEQRGEFGRLLLTIAEAERCEHVGNGRKPWWRTKRHKNRVADQLARCLIALEQA
jgi:hypothetical protein